MYGYTFDYKMAILKRALKICLGNSAKMSANVAQVKFVTISEDVVPKEWIATVNNNYLYFWGF